ncbi:hypothetical protein NS334_09115 [Sphingomonas endophytica]|uniref:DUF1996 domain-containing protein n=2 Tax=Sphingomonas endophytica TaxID=869719 RepID=A0A147I3K4_9SPHN|nr:hypothetical protein NS334_09115 [Sphingomonas endophytica]
MLGLALLSLPGAASAQQGLSDMAAPKAVADPASAAGEPQAIPSDFDINADIVPAHETGVIGAVPPSAAPDVVGAFRFLCMPGQLRFDDPIVWPGQPGQSHLHQFFGNTAADAHSTYESLRRSGDSTCMSALNRSAYWMPAMLNGRGQVVRPDYVSIYYKRRPAGDPECQRMGKACVPLPRGLRFVFGFDMVHPDAPVTGAGYFNCDGAGATQGHYKDLREAARHCPVGSQIGAVINAPACWDGKRLDSPDHRAHVAYFSWATGQERCPRSHPYVIPTFTLGSWYTVDATLGDGSRDTWHLSSDEMPGADGRMRVPGTTFHADWFGAWDDETMRMWTANCIDRMLNCSGGDLGNGRQLKQVAPFAWKASPRLVPIPSRPAVATTPHH